MAYRVRKLPYRPWPVTFTLFTSYDDGRVESSEHGFIGHFKFFTEEQFDAVLKKYPEGKNPTPAQTLENNAKIFAELMTGWSEMSDENGVPMPYSAERLAAIIKGEDGNAISGGINNALSQMRLGVAPAKNSSTSPAPGPTTSADGVATS